jgi:Flp pilus assembly protein TadD
MSSDFWSCEEYDQSAQRKYERGDYDRALAMLKEGIALYPECVELRVTLGYTQLAREEFAWARQAFEESLRLEPDHEDALVGVGETLLKLGERSRGFRAFERVLELGFGTDVDLMLSIGRALFREGLLEQAERFFRKAVSADASSADAAGDLAYTLQRRGDLEKARSWLEKALSLDQDSHETRSAYGNLLYETGDREAALRELEKIPPDRVWDPLTVWRMIELVRAFRQLSPDGRELEVYLARLEELFVAPTPEMRLLSEIEAGHMDVTFGSIAGQMDLFRPGSVTVSPDGETATSAARSAGRGQGDRKPRAGQPSKRLDEEKTTDSEDWAAIVLAMVAGSKDPEATIEDFMRATARRVHDLTGILIPDDDPEAFIKASARAGVLHIDR